LEALFIEPHPTVAVATKASMQSSLEAFEMFWMRMWFTSPSAYNFATSSLSKTG
jgi:hypothetical protein